MAEAPATLAVTLESPTLETIPPEVLGHIAFFLATAELPGPPSGLASLCSTSKSVHSALSISGNPSLYGTIFRSKFDIGAPVRRLGSQQTSASSLAEELRRRFEGLKRIRAGAGAQSDETLNQEDLWMAVFMMLEDDGKNAVQLKQFALVEEWLWKYIVDYAGGSSTTRDMAFHIWPQDNLGNRLALWLLWLCDTKGPQTSRESAVVRNRYRDILRAYAFGATKYPLTQHLWTDFSSPFSVGYQHANRQLYVHFSHPITPIAPPITIPAILGYMSRITESGVVAADGVVMSSGDRYPPERFTRAQQPDGRGSTPSEQWDYDWARCIGLNLKASGLECFLRAQALEGPWEGHFAYTEFSVYANILSGGSPQVLNGGGIGQNLQVWKLREYHLYSSSSSDSRSEVLPSQASSERTSDSEILPPGDALDAFFPPMTVEEKGDQVVFTHGSKKTIYTRALGPTVGDAGTSRKTLEDVIIFGDGHSSWGRFRLRGRVRASDAFITILKKYDGTDDRGRWLYRGYIIGGRLVGRWRDAFSPLDMPGYEGSFELGRRV